LCAAPRPVQGRTNPVHDALPIYAKRPGPIDPDGRRHKNREREREAGRHGSESRERAEWTLRSHPPPFRDRLPPALRPERAIDSRSEEHTSELQSRENLVCRLLLE